MNTKSLLCTQGHAGIRIPKCSETVKTADNQIIRNLPCATVISDVFRAVGINDGERAFGGTSEDFWNKAKQTAD